MIEPLIKTIEVPCNQETAFRIFVEDMGQWWPLDKRSMSMKDGQPSKALEVEAKLGGRIVEIGHDEREHHWGTFRTFEPFSYVAMDFHMGLPPTSASLVEVRFTAQGTGQTEVVLTQSNWEGFGDLAEMMLQGYGSGWVQIFEQGYKNACVDFQQDSPNQPG
ncbi:MAG: SRPBCC domain-containing protein [Acidobacteriota bacterium]